MQQRTASVLSVLVREFINTGQPISSKYLYETQNFKVKPATIRAELNVLTELGFIEQLHTSGGRVPTNSGYQFFVETLMAGEDDQEGRQKVFYKNPIRRDFEALDDFVGEIADSLRLLGVGYQIKGEAVYKSGLDELVAALDFDDKRDIFDVISDFEMIDERVANILDYLDGAVPKVFIGRSPVTKSRYLSVVADCYNLGNRKAVIMAIGPKRMDYQKTINIFKLFHQ